MTLGYYPFGLKQKGYNNNNTGNGNSLAQAWKFGGKELNSELGLDWYDVTARNYDPALGRWMNLDPLAELMRRHSPYNYAFDNPIFFTDPDGMMPCPTGDCPDPPNGNGNPNDHRPVPVGDGTGGNGSISTSNTQDSSIYRQGLGKVNDGIQSGLSAITEGAKKIEEIVGSIPSVGVTFYSSNTQDGLAAPKGDADIELSSTEAADIVTGLSEVRGPDTDFTDPGTKAALMANDLNDMSDDMTNSTEDGTEATVKNSTTVEITEIVNAAGPSYTGGGSVRNGTRITTRKRDTIVHPDDSLNVATQNRQKIQRQKDSIYNKYGY